MLSKKAVKARLWQAPSHVSCGSAQIELIERSKEVAVRKKDAFPSRWSRPRSVLRIGQSTEQARTDRRQSLGLRSKGVAKSIFTSEADMKGRLGMTMGHMVSDLRWVAAVAMYQPAMLTALFCK